MLLSILGALGWLFCATVLHLLRRPMAAAVCLGLAVGITYRYFPVLLGV
ncbi:MAG: hypothetical protein HOV82_17155 [Streptomyces sp.]|nr:hypothetical protein [Streptomyces sp.]NUP36180.1 hypothetical protein [Streptomyces sp.]NUS75527.1 hypothetical protein [Streptomyces sp.]